MNNKRIKSAMTVFVVVGFVFIVSRVFGLHHLIGHHLYLRNIVRTLPSTVLPVSDADSLGTYPATQEYKIYGYGFKFPLGQTMKKKESPPDSYFIDGVTSGFDIAQPVKGEHFMEIFTGENMEMLGLIQELDGTDVFRNQYVTLDKALNANPQARSLTDGYQTLTRLRIFTMAKVLFLSSSPNISKITSYAKAGYRAFQLGDVHSDKDVFLHVFDVNDVRVEFKFLGIQDPFKAEKLIKMIVQTFRLAPM